MLPLWVDLLFLAAAAAAALRAARLARRVRELSSRLQAREREGHFLGESPDPAQILAHAYRAACEILPLTTFDLYRVDPSQRISEIWTLAGKRPSERRPTLVPKHEYLASSSTSAPCCALPRPRPTDPSRRWTCCPGTAPKQRLHLPLYSGDVLARLPHARLDRADRRTAQGRDPGAPRSPDDARSTPRATGRSPSPTSCPASRPGGTSRRASPRSGRATAVTALPCRSRSSTSITSRRSTTPSATGPGTSRSGASARSSRPPSARATSRAATEARSSRSFSPRRRRTRRTPSRSACGGALEREAFSSEGRTFRVTVSAGIADTADLDEDERHQLLFRADQALYAAKDEGRNRVRLWTERRRVPRPRRGAASLDSEKPRKP